MKVLVTGASGLVGSALLPALEDGGHKFRHPSLEEGPRAVIS